MCFELGFDQPGQQLVHRLAAIDRLVAQQDHVAAGVKRDHSGLGVTDLQAVNQSRTSHAEVVAENRTREATLTAQDVAQPFGRETCGACVDFRIDDMGRHDAVQAAAEPVIRGCVVGQNRFETAFVNRNVGVRICLDEAVTGKMLAAVGHAALQEAVHQAFGQQCGDAWVAVERAVANDTAFAKIEVQHGGEAQVHTAGAQLGSQNVATRCGRIACLHGIFHPQLAQGAHGRQVGETVGLEALDAATFVVDADQQVLAHALDVAAQRAELGPVLPIAGKQDDAADQRVFEALAVCFCEREACNVDDEGSVLGHIGMVFMNNEKSDCY